MTMTTPLDLNIQVDFFDLLADRVSKGEVGHWGRYRDGKVWCSWCKSETKTNKSPPLSIVCNGCRRFVRAGSDNSIAEQL
jgi:hypothetical protein